MRYRMKTVSELTGIPRNTLVAWERRYGVPEPERLANGYRLYSDRDVEVLFKLRDALARGLSISEAVELVQSGVTAARLATEPAANEASAFSMVEDGLLEALLAFDRPRAERLVERILNVPFLTAIEEVYFPLLRKVGTLWERGDATVAQEHFASAFIRDQLVAMLLRVGARGATGPRVACVTFPGEKHELALLALAVHLSLRGARVTYLGADVPVRDLRAFLEQSQQDWLCVSVIVATPASAILEFARALARSPRNDSHVVIGGAGVSEVPLKKLPPRVEVARDWRELSIV